MFEEIWIIYVTVIHKSKSEWTRTLFPNFFWHQEVVSWKTIFPQTGAQGGVVSR